MGGTMQLRKLLISIVIGATIVAFGNSVGHCADVAKIGTVNFQKIFNNSAGGKAVKNEIKKEGTSMNADLQKLQDEIKALRDILEKDGDSGVLNETARENKKWELDKKINEVKALKRSYDRKIQELQIRLINGVKKDVLKIVADYSKKEGYLLVLEDINIVYAPQTLDITDKIIQLYDKSYAKR
jgi:outer membrane protein